MPAVRLRYRTMHGGRMLWRPGDWAGRRRSVGTGAAVMLWIIGPLRGVIGTIMTAIVAPIAYHAARKQENQRQNRQLPHHRRLPGLFYRRQFTRQRLSQGFRADDEFVTQGQSRQVITSETIGRTANFEFLLPPETCIVSDPPENSAGLAERKRMR